MSDIKSETIVESMMIEAAETASIELSEQALDTIAGGMSLDLGSASQFFQQDIMTGQQTVAGPNGAATTNLFGSSEVASAAAQLFQAKQ
jgi:hypothetical protein